MPEEGVGSLELEIQTLESDHVRTNSLAQILIFKDLSLLFYVH